MYNQDLALNNLQELICHETKTTNQPMLILYFLYNALALLHKYTSTRAPGSAPISARECTNHQSRFFLRAVHCVKLVRRSRPAVVACCTIRSDVFHHWIYLWPQGPSLQAFTLFGGVGFIAWRLRGMPTGPDAFCELPVVLGFGPATRPTLKNSLVPYSYAGGA